MVTVDADAGAHAGVCVGWGVGRWTLRIDIVFYRRQGHQ
jgi:hypothetical protein